MARKRKKKRRKRDKRVSALTIGGLLTNIFKTAPSGNFIFNRIQGQDWEGLAYDAREIFLGIDNNGKFQLNWVVDTYARPIIGFFASKVLTKLGVNREIKKIPFIGKYLKL